MIAWPLRPPPIRCGSASPDVPAAPGLFSTAAMVRVPYFASIVPHVVRMEPGVGRGHRAQLVLRLACFRFNHGTRISQGSKAASSLQPRLKWVNSIWIPSGSTKSNIVPRSPATFRISDRATPEVSSQLAHARRSSKDSASSANDPDRYAQGRTVHLRCLNARIGQILGRPGSESPRARGNGGGPHPPGIRHQEISAKHVAIEMNAALEVGHRNPKVMQSGQARTS